MWEEGENDWRDGVQRGWATRRGRKKQTRGQRKNAKNKGAKGTGEQDGNQGGGEDGPTRNTTKLEEEGITENPPHKNYFIFHHPGGHIDEFDASRNNRRWVALRTHIGYGAMQAVWRVFSLSLSN